MNSVKESLQMLDTLPDLDYVLIEDCGSGVYLRFLWV